MAKTYLDIVKYMIVVNFEIDGLVDKPDIIGAVFGQTEGLLGDELDLRELQKGGKIGRIEIDSSQSGSKTYGKLYLPASLDRIDTCILGAAIESVDRVGPFDAKFQVEKIEDTRSEKRRKILERAKNLLKTLLSTELPDSKELAELVESEVKVGEISTYGPEHLPAGPDVAMSKDVIIVEGRADVINLLKNDITNVVAVGGATSNIPKSIIQLANEKEVTVFVDGDRGGDLIIRALANVMELDYVARAPEGKEVEELTRKEIVKALRSKVPLDQYFALMKAKENAKYSQQQHENNYNRAHEQQQQQQRNQHTTAQYENKNENEELFNNTESSPQRQGPIEKTDKSKLSGFSGLSELDEAADTSLPEIEGNMPHQNEAPVKPALESVVLSELANSLNELSGTLRSRLFAADGTLIQEVPIRELFNALQNVSGIYGIALDGVVTQRLVELAQQKGIRAIYAVKSNPMPKIPSDIIIYTKEAGKLN